MSVRPVERFHVLFIMTALVGVATSSAACSSAPRIYPPTELPTQSASATDPANPQTSASATTAAEPCVNPTQTYDPLPTSPLPADDVTISRIMKRGYLIVGISADTALLGARNPLSGDIEGFDIEMARGVAQALFGDPHKIQLRVITAADRIPLLENRQVDMVSRAMTITCERWQRVAFSAEYYRAGQKVLVPRDTPNASLHDFADQPVCTNADTSSEKRLREFKTKVVPADNTTGCLVLLRHSSVVAITGDDVILAGLAQQDPWVVVSSAPRISDEPYGLAFNKNDINLVRVANTVLANMMADGRWKNAYDRWLQPTLGPSGPAPAPVYGRALE